jgi:hypothetical protein
MGLFILNPCFPVSISVIVSAVSLTIPNSVEETTPFQLTFEADQFVKRSERGRHSPSIRLALTTKVTLIARMANGVTTPIWHREAVAQRSRVTSYNSTFGSPVS